MAIQAQVEGVIVELPGPGADVIVDHVAGCTGIGRRQQGQQIQCLLRQTCVRDHIAREALPRTAVGIAGRWVEDRHRVQTEIALGTSQAFLPRLQGRKGGHIN